MKRQFNRRGSPLLSSFTGGIFRNLPVLAIVGGIIWLFASGALSGLFKGLKAIFDGLGDTVTGFKDWFQYGGAGQADNIKAQLKEMLDAAKKTGLQVTPITRSKAIKLHDTVNSYHAMSLSSMLTMDESLKIRDLFINNTLEDQARILLAYGEQSVPSRLLIWNIVWDDTSGTFRDHVSRYIPEGEVQKQILHYVDFSYNTYLT